MQGPSAAAVGSEPISLIKGNGLDGWHVLGAADWQSQNGHLVGRAKSTAGGWLIADTGYQDFVLHVSFECSTCDAGVLVRGAKSVANLTGIYVPLGGPQMGKLYRASLSGVNQDLGNLKPMPTPATPPAFQGAINAGPCDPINCDGIRDGHGGAESHTAAAAAKPVQLHSGWNELAITMRGDVIIAGVNGTALASAEMDDGPWYGEIALRAAGSAENAVQFKDVTVKDLTLRGAGETAIYTDPQFRRDELTHFFYSEGIAAGDLNHNGAMDVVFRAAHFRGPEFCDGKGAVSARSRMMLAVRRMAI